MKLSVLLASRSRFSNHIVLGLALTISAMITLSGCSASTRTKAIVTELPPVSEIEHVKLPSGREVLVRRSGTFALLIVGADRSPFSQIVREYSDHAGERALISSEYSKAWLPFRDREFLYESMVILGGPDVMHLKYIWRQQHELPLMIIYELESE